jgi:ABC-type polar amino acid transport system ATPase subunit
MAAANSMTANVLQLNDVRLHRGEREVLAGVTLTVPRGEIVALMGPSGCGKTSVLRLIAGLEPFQSGTVQLEDLTMVGNGGNSAKTLRALRRRIGMVFQFHHLFEHLPAIKNVWLAPVHAHGIPYRDAVRRAQELLALLGVEHRANALPGELSGGEAQRVAIARALAVDPPLLLLDEPTASLDSARRSELRELLQRLVGEGRTLLIATHDEEFASACATRVLRMSNGIVLTRIR